MRVKRSDSRQFFYMDTLKYLRHGGRIGRVSSFVGEALHIKPIISCDPDGVYYTVAKIRGRKPGMKKLLDLLAKYADGHRCWIVIGNGNAAKEAEEFRQMVEERIPHGKILFMHQIVASMANHTGPGLIGLEVFVDP